VDRVSAVVTSDVDLAVIRAATMGGMFEADERDRARAFVLDKARSDERIVAAAIIGSFARGTADHWSDLDLTFAVADDASVSDVLADWTAAMASEFGTVDVLDLEVGPTIYRVFMFPSLLQVDLSFTPAAQFAPRAPAFELVFGETGEFVPRPRRSQQDVFGWGAVHAIHAWRCIRRGRPEQALHSIVSARELGLALAALRRDMEPSERTWDDLPADVRARAAAAIAASTEPGELLTALRGALDLLLSEADDVGESATMLGPRLRALLEEPLPRRVSTERSQAAP
jgi:predicted nucleotidyltransferase